jgi:isopentenyldiphosphate isomerase
MELLHTVRPETGEPVGAPVTRAEALAGGAWCRSTSVFVINPRGEVLCHKRSEEKERLPGVWSTHLGGHVAVGETYETNAAKELHEESGIAAAPSGLIGWRTTRLESARLWVREFVTLVDAPAESLVPQPGEVDGFRWMSPEEIALAAKADAERWCVGTHDFAVEYQCMLAVLNAAGALGAIATPEPLRVWGSRPSSLGFAAA